MRKKDMAPSIGLKLEDIPDGIPTKVNRVIVKGLKRSKDDFIVSQIKPALEAENLKELCSKTQAVKRKLGRLRIFKTIDIHIDTSKGSSDPTGYDVFIDVEERNYVLNIMTELQSESASLITQFGLPNILGRAERLNFDYKHGTKHIRSFTAVLNKPMNGNPDYMLGGNVYQSSGEFPFSGYKELDRGLGLNFSFPTLLGAHVISWEGVWRDLRALSRTTSLEVRENSGHSLKSSIKHEFKKDNRDDQVFPRKGMVLKLIQEYAGGRLGGNADFLRNEVEFQANKQLFFDMVLQLSLAGGLLRNLDPTNKILINDRFFLGGPTSLRGFETHGVGPHSDGDALGGEAYWSAGMHLFTPLPFRPGKGGFGELFRSQFFVNAGDIGNLNISDLNEAVLKQYWQNIGERMRLSCGCGVVLRVTHFARLELNYVWPLWLQRGDSSSKGIQFGLGMTFM